MRLLTASAKPPGEPPAHCSPPPSWSNAATREGRATAQPLHGRAARRIQDGALTPYWMQAASRGPLAATCGRQALPLRIAPAASRVKPGSRDTVDDGGLDVPGRSALRASLRILPAAWRPIIAKIHAPQSLAATPGASGTTTAAWAGSPSGWLSLAGASHQAGQRRPTKAARRCNGTVPLHRTQRTPFSSSAAWCATRRQEAPATGAGP